MYYHHNMHNMILACFLTQCPNGSRCITCNDSDKTYCEKSCDYKNGGCKEESVEVVVLTCNPGQCCSRVDITCPGKLMNYDYA